MSSVRPEDRSVIDNYKAIPITEARKNLRDLIDDVAYRASRFILSKTGRPVAAVVPIDDLVTLARHDSFRYRGMLAEADDARDPQDEGVPIQKALDGVKSHVDEGSNSGVNVASRVVDIWGFNTDGVEKHSVEEVWATVIGMTAVEDLQQLIVQEVITKVCHDEQVCIASYKSDVAQGVKKAFRRPAPV